MLLEAWQNGRFEFTTASGRKLLDYKVQDLPPVQTVAGPWQLKFPAGSAAPKQLAFDRWSPGISSRRTP